jgi:hypothetical protein
LVSSNSSYLLYEIVYGLHEKQQNKHTYQISIGNRKIKRVFCRLPSTISENDKLSAILKQNEILSTKNNPTPISAIRVQKTTKTPQNDRASSKNRI